MSYFFLSLIISFREIVSSIMLWEGNTLLPRPRHCHAMLYNLIRGRETFCSTFIIVYSSYWNFHARVCIVVLNCTSILVEIKLLRRLLVNNSLGGYFLNNKKKWIDSLNVELNAVLWQQLVEWLEIVIPFRKLEGPETINFKHWLQDSRLVQ